MTMDCLNTKQWKTWTTLNNTQISTNITLGAKVEDMKISGLIMCANLSGLSHRASEYIQMPIYWLHAHKDNSHIALHATNGFIQQNVPITL